MINQYHLEKWNELPNKTKKELQASNPKKEVTQKQSVYASKLTDIVKEAKEFAKHWGKTIQDVELEHSSYQYEYSESYSSMLEMCVQGLETDDQYYARLNEYYEANKLREEYDRREFERLKTKFSK
jgi:hypothetical protein